MPKYVEHRYIPKNQRDTRYYLWYETYLCQVPLINIMSDEEVSMFGMPRSGDAVMDKTVGNELRTLQIPIVTMAEYYGEGARIAVVNYNDTEKIYKRITDHLQVWKNRISRCLNLGEVPFDDLLLLDRFANVIYDKAKYAFTSEYISSVVTEFSGNSQARSLYEMLNKIETVVPQQGVRPKDRDSYGPKEKQWAPRSNEFDEFFSRASTSPQNSLSLNTGVASGGSNVPKKEQSSGAGGQKIPTFAELLSGKKL